MDNFGFSSKRVESWEPALRSLATPPAAFTALPSEGVAIVAGHYCVAPSLEDLSASGEAEEQSFFAGILLRKRLLAQGISAPIVVWVNDIGISPNERSAIKENYRLPANYERIWGAYADGAPQSDLHIWFESTMRNTASTLVRRIIKQRPEAFSVLRSDDPSLVRCVDDERCAVARGQRSVYVVAGPNGERLVVKDGPNPKCNLILATLFRNIQERLRVASTVCIFNEVYRHRIRLGFYVARTLTAVEMDLHAAFCDGSALYTEDFNLATLAESRSITC